MLFFAVFALLGVSFSAGLPTPSSLEVHSFKETDASGRACRACCSPEKQDSGYINLPNRVDSHYFYWYFESCSEPATDPLMLWIPGGPGMGGTFGLLAENGPCTVNADLSTKLNPFSWTASANMVWVDLPANSGFSYSTTAEDDEFTDERVSESVFWFLQGFFRKHQDLIGRELFLVGESYGGHYIPSIAHYIWKKQGEHLFAPASAESIPINLRGVSVGNGLTDPVEVLTHYIDMANNPYNITVVNDTQLEAMEAAVAKCRSFLNVCQVKSSSCGAAGSFCQVTQLLPLLEAHRSPYDLRRPCESAISNASACIPNVPSIKAYLDLPKLRAFLEVNPRRGEWILLNSTINAAFFGAPSYSGFKSVEEKLSELLDAGLRVLLYAGDADILCDNYAIKATAEKLNWFGSTGFSTAKERSYMTARGIDAGTVQSYSSLTYVKVYNAGHMVPADQPEVALDMISRFLQDKPL
ncbi:unnamed protein product [Phytophthora lilii]|uniref:Carboxypeptidase n=1 Tax=Phytophthora lilii TaxID=2077276 RepID=A0A9W6WHJ7_9STRA|nr:unnamed protein product [Phytophthora lilii]